MIKAFLSIIILSLSLSSAQAQENNVLSLALEIGFLDGKKSENTSIFFNLEPKHKLTDNTTIGMRINATINAQSFENNDASQFIIPDEFDNGFLSFLPTCDYYARGYKLEPYIGLGIGPYLVGNKLDVFPIDNPILGKEALEITLKYQLGMLLRGGVEFGKSRIGLEYNFIPDTDIKIANGQTIGKANSRYFGLTYGYIFRADRK